MNLDNNILESLSQYAERFAYYRTHPIQFIKDCVKIPLPGGPTTFKMYNKQEELIRELLKHHYIICLKSRQIGVSTVVQAFITWLTTFYSNIVVGVISRDGPEATDFARKVINMIEELPQEFKPKFEKKTEQSFILENKSALYVGIVNPSRPSAVFRGKAITLLVVDEAAFIANMDDAYTAITPALLQAHKKARERGIPYGAVIMSTPNGTVKEGQWFYEMWSYAVQNPGDPYYPVKIHWKDIPEFANDPAWYEQQCKLFKYDKRKIAQELDLAFLSPASSVFDADVCEQLQKQTQEPIAKYDVREGISKVGELWFWSTDFLKDIEEPHIVVAVDPATAFGSSQSAIQIFEITTMTQIAELSAKCEVTTLQELLDKTIMPKFPNALLVIEANSIGNQLIEYFSKSKWMLNLYYQPVQDKKLHIRDRRPGLYNDNKTRPLIIDAMYTCVKEFTEGIRSQRLALQLIGLQERNGRIQGSPDDLCLAYGFAAYIRQYAFRYAISTQKLSPEMEEDMFKVVDSNIEFDNTSNNYISLQPQMSLPDEAPDDFDEINFDDFFKVESDYAN